MSTIVVYGGNGGLGRAVISAFKAKGWTAVSVDFGENAEADRQVRLESGQEWSAQLQSVLKQLEGVAPDVVYCAAGGWNGGDARSDDLCAGVDRLIDFNLKSAIACASVAARTLKEGGLLVLTGAAAALQGTPGMLAYGVTKAATHQLVASMAADPKNKFTSAAILPITLDTPNNRSAMPDADTSTWTPLSFIADTVLGWTEKAPAQGGLYKVVTENNETQLVKV